MRPQVWLKLKPIRAGPPLHLPGGKPHDGCLHAPPVRPNLSDWAVVQALREKQAKPEEKRTYTSSGKGFLYWRSQRPRKPAGITGRGPRHNFIKPLTSPLSPSPRPTASAKHLHKRRLDDFLLQRFVKFENATSSKPLLPTRRRLHKGPATPSEPVTLQESVGVTCLSTKPVVHLACSAKPVVHLPRSAPTLTTCTASRFICGMRCRRRRAQKPHDKRSAQKPHDKPSIDSWMMCFSLIAALTWSESDAEHWFSSSGLLDLQAGMPQLHKRQEAIQAVKESSAYMACRVTDFVVGADPQRPRTPDPVRGEVSSKRDWEACMADWRRSLSCLSTPALVAQPGLAGADPQRPRTPDPVRGEVSSKRDWEACMADWRRSLSCLSTPALVAQPGLADDHVQPTLALGRSRSFLEQVNYASLCEPVPASNELFLAPGNCIPLAIYRLDSDLSKRLMHQIAGRPTPAYRTYRDFDRITGYRLVPQSPGCLPSFSGKFLVHLPASSNARVAHACAVEVRDGNVCVLYDGSYRHTLSWCVLVAAFRKASDSSCVCFFRLVRTRNYRREMTSDQDVLLGAWAGAGHGSATSSSSSSSRTNCSSVIVDIKKKREEAMVRRAQRLVDSGILMQPQVLMRISCNRRLALQRLRTQRVLPDVASDRPFAGVDLRWVVTDMSVGRAPMPPSGTPLRLATHNAHRLDSRVEFMEDEHVYILDGSVQFPISVSGVWGRFFSHFNPSEAVDTYFHRWSTNPMSKYFGAIEAGRAAGQSDDEIKRSIVASWREAGAAASAQGTRLHRQIELFLNAQPTGEWNSEMETFVNFINAEILPRN